MEKKKNLMILTMFLLIGLLTIWNVIFYTYTKCRFLPNTFINNEDVSNLTFKEAITLLEQSENKDNTVVITERESKIERIDGTQIGLRRTINIDDAIGRNQLCKNIFSFSPKQYNADISTSFEQNRLRETLKSLPSFQENAMQRPENACIVYDCEYRIQEGELGNLIDFEKTMTLIEKELHSSNKNIILSDECYLSAEITKESPELIAKLEYLDNITTSSVIYTLGLAEIQLDVSIFHEWIDIDKLAISEEAAAEWIGQMAKDADTVYTKRTFQVGERDVTVSGPYGYRIDQPAELEQMLEDIQSGNVIVREPVYAQAAASRMNELGGTFVAVDLTSQHVYLYENGSVIQDSSCVTGNESAGNATPDGIYPLAYKQENAVLRGPGYASPVSYWMPFNRGIGLHDASWRSTFGGAVYKTNGSHGCINLPKSMAAAIFEVAYQGMPVICYE